MGFKAHSRAVQQVHHETVSHDLKRKVYMAEVGRKGEESHCFRGHV